MKTVVEFPPATARQRRVEYRLEVTATYPKLPGIERSPLYDGFRRDWLNIFQVNPRVQMLANNASSDPCSFTLFEYSDLALHTPPLADGLTANDLIRMPLDRSSPARWATARSVMVAQMAAPTWSTGTRRGRRSIRFRRSSSPRATT
jgi:hypothetical protein